MSTLSIVIGLLICLSGTLLFGQFGLRVFISYRLTPHQIEVILCNVIPLKRIRFSDARNVEIVSFKDLLLFVSVRSFSRCVLAIESLGKGF
jgi:hypothetical protein